MSEVSKNKSEPWLKGTISWPHDPFFRPTISIYQGPNFVLTAPTSRVPFVHSDGTEEWVCAFEIQIPEGYSSTAFPALTIACLETGEILDQDSVSAHNSRPDSTGALSVDNILAIGRKQRPPWDATGFADFLEISVIDQINLIYFDLLGRNADLVGLRSYAYEILSGDKTILDIRDDILSSDEFQRRGLSSEERAGNWIVWGGLKLASPNLVPSSGPESEVGLKHRWYANANSAFIGYLESISADADLSEHLAKIALGANKDYFLKEKWQRDHSQIINVLEARLKANQMRRFNGPRQNSYPISLRKFLASMQQDQTGREKQSKVVSLEKNFSPGLLNFYRRSRKTLYGLTVFARRKH